MDLLCDAIGFSHETGPPQLPSASHPHPEATQSEQQPSRTTPHRQCHLCGRSYERLDHLNRHLKSHENARPHKCTRTGCAKSFNRADLLNRHQASHDRPVKEGRPAIDRVAAACISCVTAKVKCQDQRPCARCQRRGVFCETPASQRNLTHHSSIELLDKRAGHSDPRFENTQNGTAVVDVNNGMINGTIDQTHSTSNQHFDELTSASTYYNGVSVSSHLDQSFLEYGDISQIPADSLFSPSLGLVPRDAYFSQDTDFGLWDFDLDSVELRYRTEDEAGSNQAVSQQPHNPPHSPQKDASKRYAAFERSPWLWKPTQKDRGLNDQNDLHVDEDSIPSVLTPDSPGTVIDLERFFSCSISVKERDKLLSLLFSVQKSVTKSPSLPCLSLLNSIIQVFFVQESFKVDHLIHHGTFTPSTTLPQLLLSIVAAGSTLISIPAIWKMGLALQEVARHTLGEYWEQDNSRTRHLQALQAFMIALDVGLWSGFKRKIEIAESFAQPIIIMLRRAGAFNAPENPALLDPLPEDSQAVVESKWRKWAERESFKRLVLHIFIHDVHSSIGFQKPPQISFTELSFYLPASRKLWLAKTSTEWKDLYAISKSSQSLPTFVDAIHQPEILHQYSAQVDIHLTTIALLHGHWGEVYSLNESKRFFPSSKATHRLWIHTAYTELYRDLTSFSQHLPSLTNNSPEADLISEILRMILHISPADLHRFAGKFGENEARKATEELTEWAKTKESRLAIWHAGQVFRAANRLLAAQNRGFNAIALYFAGLTLWVYGHTAPNSTSTRGAEHLISGDSNSNSTFEAQYIVINEGETPKSALFLASSQGIPVVATEKGNPGDEKKYVELGETSNILSITREVYRKNFRDLEEPLPPLVDNLCNLLRDLESLPGSRVSRAPSQDPVEFPR